ncbi:hypothetical protein QYF36_012403 [Acer negundo]|nr:hypothetical protein QYF36_012403 [Acer negundo]
MPVPHNDCSFKVGKKGVRSFAKVVSSSWQPLLMKNQRIRSEENRSGFKRQEVFSSRQVGTGEISGFLKRSVGGDRQSKREIMTMEWIENDQEWLNNSTVGLVPEKEYGFKDTMVSSCFIPNQEEVENQDRVNIRNCREACNIPPFVLNMENGIMRDSEISDQVKNKDMLASNGEIGQIINKKSMGGKRSLRKKVKWSHSKPSKDHVDDGRDFRRVGKDSSVGCRDKFEIASGGRDGFSKVGSGKEANKREDHGSVEMSVMRSSGLIRGMVGRCVGKGKKVSNSYYDLTSGGSNPKEGVDIINCGGSTVKRRERFWLM